MYRHLLKSSLCRFDPLSIATRWTSEEKLIQEMTRKFAKEELRPNIINEFRNNICNKNLIKSLGNLGLLGITTLDNPLSYTSYGIIAKELESVDSAYRSALSVQSSLVIYPVSTFGTDYQKKKYLPALRSGDLIGCFGLTEPGHGSNPSGMKTTAVLDKEHYVLDGIKTWITNSPISDIAIIWAKEKIEQEDVISGFIVDTHTQGISTPSIDNKLSLRASTTGQIIMDQVKVPLKNKLDIQGLKGPLSCLNQARFGIAWGVTGIISDCLDQTLDYADSRTQFGKSLSEFQLVQSKLSDIVSKLALCLSSCQQLSELKQKKIDSPEMTSILKKYNCNTALETSQTCRDILGGNGIVDDYSPIRHLLNMQSVNTYEGTSDIHSLIIGKAITGANAFN